MQAAGLTCTTRRGSTIDRFRDRLIFGIRDLDGDLVGFTARCAPGVSAAVPKYLNTPHTALYNKSSSLFGLGEQAPRLRDGANLVLVEGPLDALAVDLLNTDDSTRLASLAACGTAMSTQHGEVLASLVHSHTIIAFERDPAGLKASERAAIALGSQLPSMYTATLPRGSDPATVLADAGARGLRNRVMQLRPLTDAVMAEHIAAWPNLRENAEARVGCLRELSHLLHQIAPYDISRQATRLPALLGLDQVTVTRELADAVSCSPERDSAAMARAVGARQERRVRI